MVQLVEKMDSMNVRLSRLETLSLTANNTNTTTHAKSNHRISGAGTSSACKFCCSHSNGPMSSTAGGDSVVIGCDVAASSANDRLVSSTNENGPLMKSLTNITARLTLLENSISFLNSQQVCYI